MTLQVANTIREQIGAPALFMIGAKQFIGDETSLKFKVGRNAKGATHVRVTLLGDDTYEVAAWRLRRGDWKCLGTQSGIYADQLRGSIRALTGLETTMPKVVRP